MMHCEVPNERLNELMQGADPTTQERLYLEDFKKRLDKIRADEGRKLRAEKAKLLKMQKDIAEGKVSRNKRRNMRNKLRRS